FFRRKLRATRALGGKKHFGKQRCPECVSADGKPYGAICIRLAHPQIALARGCKRILLAIRHIACCIGMSNLLAQPFAQVLGRTLLGLLSSFSSEFLRTWLSVFIEIAKLLLNNLGNLCTCCLFCHLAAAFLLRPAFTFSAPLSFLLGFLALALRCFFSFLLAAPLFFLA